ncbi:MAG: hypothetical protein IJR44_04575 [Neisseriaceae bacterium]|nr:hypothetical protein [Neisseriaceae bacterium]
MRASQIVEIMQAEIFNEDIQNFVFCEIKDACDFLGKKAPTDRDIESMTAEIIKQKSKQLNDFRELLVDAIVEQIERWEYSLECEETDKYMMGEL